MAKQPNAKQLERFNDLVGREGVLNHRICWEGKTLCLGVTMEAREPGGVPITRMYKIDQEGKAVGV